MGWLTARVFLKQTQPRILVNQHISTMCVEVERNQENQKQEKQDKIIKTIRDRIIRDIKNLFEQEEDYCKPVRVTHNFHSNNYIKYESNGEVKPY